MRKILVASALILLLTSCGTKKESSDFSGLYKNYVVAGISDIDSFAESVGYRRHESIEGAIKAGLEIPVLMSGSFASDYSVKINNTDTNLILENVKSSFESPMSNGSITAKKIGLTSITGDIYLLMEDFMDEGLFPAEARAIFAKYNNKWLSYTQEDMDDSLIEQTPEEIMISTVAKNIAKMGIKDVERYFTSYPIWKSTADLGMSGSIHQFAIDMDRDSVMKLVKSVMLDLSGSGMDADMEKEIRDNLDALTFSGILAFDQSNARVMNMNMNISQSGVMIATARASSNDTHTELHWTSTQDDTEISLVMNQDNGKNDMSLALKQGGIEVGSLVASILRQNDVFRELAIEATSQGVSLALKHAIKEDGNFEGKLSLPVGAINWTGRMNMKKLESLSLKGSMPTGSVDMSLTSVGNMLRGPLVIKSGSEEVLRANIGLRLEEEIFAFDLSLVNPDGGDVSLKTNLEFTHKSNEFKGTILPPSGVEPLKNLIQELEAIVPQEQAIPLGSEMEGLEISSSESSPLELGIPVEALTESTQQ
ncbi:hypothetical protein KBD33_04380 [Candidatus Gracilibacteria bacterium]|nr:hypothetical protein [Candidatus Gracilibacteria bacterium]